jgi:hypothetical protein
MWPPRTAVTFNGIGAKVAGLSLVSLSSNLVDSAGTTFSCDAIPASLSLFDFFFVQGSIEFEGETTRRVRGSISSPAYTVPEPGAPLLLALLSRCCSAPLPGDEEVPQPVPSARTVDTPPPLPVLGRACRASRVS